MSSSSWPAVEPWPQTTSSAKISSSGLESNSASSDRSKAFAICLVEEIRSFSGTANGGTVTFKTKFENGKTTKVLPGMTFTSVPVHCSNGDTIHGVIVDEARRVRRNAFRAHTDSEVGQPQAAFTLPTGYRPCDDGSGGDLLFVSNSGNAGQAARIDIGVDGNVTAYAYATSSHLTLSGITFPTAHC